MEVREHVIFSKKPNQKVESWWKQEEVKEEQINTEKLDQKQKARQTRSENNN